MEVCAGSDHGPGWKGQARELNHGASGLPLQLPQLLPSQSLPPPPAPPCIRDSREVEPGVITGYLLPPYKSNRLFGLVRLKLTYQPAAVL